jgi:hypothetical protein
VAALEADLKKLAAPEAAQVFEAVRGRIVGADSFDMEPPGIAGLEILVRAHPALTDNLFSFLEALPRSRLGLWACKGWGSVFKSAESMARFDRLLQAWEKDGNPALKTTAASVLRFQKKGGV